MDLAYLPPEEKERQIKEIQDGLLFVLVGKDKNLSLICGLSLASSTAFMIGMPKAEVMGILSRLYDKRIAEDRQRQAATEPESSAGDK